MPFSTAIVFVMFKKVSLFFLSDSYHECELGCRELEPGNLVSTYILICTPSGSLYAPNTKWWPPIKAKFDWTEKPFNSMSSYTYYHGFITTWFYGDSPKFQIAVITIEWWTDLTSYKIQWQVCKSQLSWHHYGQILMVLSSNTFLGMYQSPWIP